MTAPGPDDSIAERAVGAAAPVEATPNAQNTSEEAPPVAEVAGLVSPNNDCPSAPCFGKGWALVALVTILGALLATTGSPTAASELLPAKVRADAPRRLDTLYTACRTYRSGWLFSDVPVLLG
jgi:hypothetical protein